MSKANLAKIHIAKKELRLHDDDYRSLLETITGQRTAAGLSDAQEAAVIQEMVRRGWKPSVVSGSKVKAPAPKSRADSHAAKKARALWISLWQLGVIRTSSETALEAFGKRQIGVDKLQWGNDGDMFKLIEALKKMAERAGWSQDVSGFTAGYHVLILKRRLVAAQCAVLKIAKPTGYLEWDEIGLSKCAAELAKRIHVESIS